MRCIIAGSRGITDYEVVAAAMEACGFADKITSVVSGMARGVDRLGQSWGAKHDLPIWEFPADWNAHGAAAGPIRNRQMAEHADALVAVWDGKSPGTRDMVGVATAKGLRVYVHRSDGRAAGEVEP